MSPPVDKKYMYGYYLSHPDPEDEIVISGIAGMYPGCDSIEELKQELFAKKNLITKNVERWKMIKDDEMPKSVGIVKNVRTFDAGFFGVPYKQVDCLDPICRIGLEKSCEAILDAGFNPCELQGKNVAVFVGNSFTETSMELPFKGLSGSDVIRGCFREVIANRISYWLKINGPNLVVDTACSSSLTALDFGYRAIRNGECDSALILGTNLCLNPNIISQFNRLGLLSETGTCKSFSNDANGYVRSEAVVAAYIQRAKDARRIYAKVVHVKLNCDGYKEFGITFPSRNLQRTVMEDMYAECDIDPSTVGFVEAHATGTVAGDPEESSAVTQIFCKNRRKALPVGSVKSNLGHTESASGLTSISKAIIIMHTGLIPPNINFDTPRDEIEGLFNGQLRVVTEQEPLDGDLVSINNFGFGGANAHLVLRRYEKVKDFVKFLNLKCPRIVCFSGRNANSIDSLIKALTETQLDLEFIRLLHEIFKNHIDGFSYRAYLILNCIDGKPKVVDEQRGFFYNRCPHTVLRLHLNDQVKIDDLTNILWNFEKIVPFKLVFNQCYKLLPNSENFSLVLLQIGLMHIIKQLNIVIDEISGFSFVTKLIALYFDNIIDLTELCNLINGSDNEINSIFRNENSIHKTKYFEDDTKFNAPICFEFKTLSKHEFYEICDLDSLLKTIGKLYLNGGNFPLHELYEKIEFPVSRETPMISPLIHWNHSKEWKIIEFRADDKIEYCQRVARVSLSEITYSFLIGHTIDSKILMPATGYLILVWETLALHLGKSYQDVSVVMKKIRFLKATHISNERPTEFKIKIQKLSGKFEIEESDSLVASGIAYVPEKKISFLTEEMPQQTFNETMSQRDIYLNMKLRGYQFSGKFQSLVEANIDGDCARIKWDNNYTVFLDGLLQTYFLNMDTSLLYIPIYIEELVIDVDRHKEEISAMSDSTLTAYSFPHLKITRCGGIELRGLSGSDVSRRYEKPTPLLESYEFVPHTFTNNSLEQAIRFMINLIVENLPNIKIQILEMIDENYNKKPVSDYLIKVLNNMPLVQAKVTVCAVLKDNMEFECKEIEVINKNQLKSDNSEYMLVIASEILSRSNEPSLKLFFESVNANAFVISREFEAYNYIGEQFTIIEEHKCLETNEKLILLRKKSFRKTQPIYFNVDNNYTDWIPLLKNLIKKKKRQQYLVLHGQGHNENGLLGFANCLRREPDLDDTRCLLIIDESKEIPEFNPKLEFYKNQLDKNLVTNIFKDKQWGTYRRNILLNQDERVINPFHSWIDTLIRTDISSLQWMQGPIQLENKDNLELKMVHVYYTALNFRDIMFTMGKLTPNVIFKSRQDEYSVQGAEFSGIDVNGKRVMGLIRNSALGTVLYPIPSLTYEIPSNWTLEDAATVPVAYITSLFGLIYFANLKKNDSVLIHLGSGGVGQAAINIALFYGCEVFTTVGSQKKREFILKTYTQIPDRHIGYSRDTSFEEMVMAETKGRGVDIVLNSLADEKLEASIRCLAIGGRFIEIGKVDFINNTLLGLEMLKKGQSFSSVCFDDTSEVVKNEISEMLVNGIKSGMIKPLTRSIYIHNQFEEAFKFVAQGKHIGKILIKYRNENQDGISDVQPPIEALPRFYANSKNSVFVLVGGLGGFGLELADWLVMRGAKKLIIMSRKGLSDGYQKRYVQLWKKYGVYVDINTSDLTNYEETYNLIKYAQDLGELQAIFHLAVVLRDAIFENQTVDNFEMLFKAKVLITRNLDSVTRILCPKLKYFILFSSVTCSLGNAGQTNYGMANSVLERISEKRVRDGFSSLVIEWGAVGDVGLAAKLHEKSSNSDISGTLPQPITNCLETIDSFLTTYNGKVNIVSSIIVSKTKFGDKSSGNIVDSVAKILGIKDLKTISLHSTLEKLGMDSMMTVETKQVLEQRFNLFLTRTEIRQMTFAKLIEIASENAEEQVTKTSDQNEDNSEKVYKYFGDDKIASEEVVNIKCMKTPKLGEVFFIPGIAGIFTILESLAVRIYARNICLQLPYFAEKPVITIEHAVSMHLKNIEKLLKSKKNFMIVGVSYGASIALELAYELEQKNYNGKIVLVDGSPDVSRMKVVENNDIPSDETLNINLAIQLSEILCVKSDLMNVKSDLSDKNNDNESRKNILLKYLPDNIALSDDYVKSIYDVGFDRVRKFIHYKPSFVSKLKTKVLLIKPTLGVLPNTESDYGLNKYLLNPDKQLKIVTVEGDHETILDNYQCSDEIMKFFLDK